MDIRAKVIIHFQGEEISRVFRIDVLPSDTLAFHIHLDKHLKLK